MKSTTFKKSLFCLVFILLASTALAVENFKVPVPRLKVYAQPSTTSQVLTILVQGQTVQAGSNPAGGFKKVLIVDLSGKKKIGYVALGDLGGLGAGGGGVNSGYSGRQNYSSSRRRSGGSGLHNHWAMGFYGGAGYQSEGSGRTLTDSTNAVATATSLTATAPEFGLSIIYPWSQKFNLNLYLGYKSSNLTGTYTATSVPVGLTPTFTINETFLTVGATAEFYLNNNGNFWFGPGILLDYGLGATATLGSTNYTLSTNQFVELYVAVGYHIGITDNLFLTPEFRFGSEVNASPMILEIDGMLRLSYRF